VARVRLSGSLICAAQAQSEIVRHHLAEHIELTRSEPGCLSFEVTETDNPLVWQVEELFVDQAAFDAHQARTKASQWADKTAAIRRSYQITTE
jgi:quinol monooxygenase YgiN